MFVSDMLITDYSFVIFEYALLNKPIAFFCYDLEEYNRDFYIRYPEDLQGEICRTQEELIKLDCEGDWHKITERHNKFVEQHMSACDGRSCERIAEVIENVR